MPGGTDATAGSPPGRGWATPKVVALRYGGCYGVVLKASGAQRKKVRDQGCVVCGVEGCDPAHVVDRSLGGCDDALCVVPLCRVHHRSYDEGGLDLLPALEPGFREELAHGLGHVGLFALYRRVTNTRGS